MVPNPGDTTFHLSWPKQAAEGLLLFETKYIGDEPKTRLVFNLMFLLWGWIARAFDASVFAVFHPARVVLTVLYLAAIYRFANIFFRDHRAVRSVLLLASTASGFGWLLPIKKAMELAKSWPSLIRGGPADNWFIEVSAPWFCRWEVVVTPTALLLVSAIGGAIAYARTGSRRELAIGAICLALLSFVHPHDCLTAGVVSAAAVAICRPLPSIRAPERRTLAMYFCAPLPKLAYDAWVVTQEPSFASYVGIEDRFLAGDLILGFGLLPPLAIAGLAAALVRHVRRLDIAACASWPLAIAAFHLLPFNLVTQVFVFHALQVPLSVLAIYALRATIPGAKAYAAAAAVILLSLPTSVLKYREDLARAKDRGSPSFLSADYARALDFLDGAARPDEVVLAPETLAYWVPSKTGARVFYAFKPFPYPGFADAQLFLRTFYGESNHLTREEARAELSRRGVDWLIVGTDRASSTGRPADVMRWLHHRTREEWRLKPAWSSPSISVFSVERW